MPWGESVRLFTVLQGDPGSRVFAALAEWDHPLSWGEIDQRALLEVYLRVNHDSKAGAFKPLSWPWPTEEPEGRTRYGTTARTQEEVWEALRARGHRTPLDPPERPRDARGRFVKREASSG